MVEKRVFRNNNRIRNYFKNRKHYHGVKYLGVGIFLVALLIVGTWTGYVYDVKNVESDSFVGRVLSALQDINFRGAPEERIMREFPEINLENLAEFMSYSEFVNDLPEDASIMIYVGETPYFVTKGNVEQKEVENADIVLWIPESYISELSENEFCEVVASANENGEIGYDTNLSNFELLVKYRSMLQYRDCLGL